MRIGIIALLHESNTFVRQPTTLTQFHEDLYLEGESIREQLANSHHEIGGFFAGLEQFTGAGDVVAVPLLATRATPSGIITAETMDALVARILALVEATPDLDGILVAPHGAAVSQLAADADGYWLSRLREHVGKDLPIIGTLDAHANLSPVMVQACNALVAYRTNPHLDQRARGIEAASLMVRTVRGEVRPTMAATFPPLVINIERQCTSEPHWQPHYQFADEQLSQPNVLSNSILLGFPYADVAEMGAATIVVTDNDAALAQRLADELADRLWQHRADFVAQLTSIEAALQICEADSQSRYCLLDMGDNVGGGSAADGTTLAAALLSRRLVKSFVCLYDPESVAACSASGIGIQLSLTVGGKVDDHHGSPLAIVARVVSLHTGCFREDAPRHGGIVEFDQGATAVVETLDRSLTIMLTSRRMVPFSLQQIKSCQLDPLQFRILVAKGVNAPLAAYREVCDKFLRVNTLGSTSADLNQLDFLHRRRPLYPFEAM
ncbi:MAG: M81 family metallopeptidase [Pirellulaceae bacterium]|nr:M81 family metallopeptidase [Pirellulaceae bacterium]